MVTASPPVSPSVVAKILMIQKRSVTCGTLVAIASRFELRTCIGLLPVSARAVHEFFGLKRSLFITEWLCFRNEHKTDSTCATRTNLESPTQRRRFFATKVARQRK